MGLQICLLVVKIEIVENMFSSKYNSKKIQTITL